MRGVNRFVCLMLAAAAAGWASAFPTDDELAKAGKLVDDLMAADFAAARAGKKTHEEVADAAMALAEEAVEPAKKSPQNRKLQFQVGAYQAANTMSSRLARW